jgi:hypothetical protein
VPAIHESATGNSNHQDAKDTKFFLAAKPQSYLLTVSLPRWWNSTTEAMRHREGLLRLRREKELGVFGVLVVKTAAAGARPDMDGRD